MIRGTYSFSRTRRLALGSVVAITALSLSPAFATTPGWSQGQIPNPVEAPTADWRVSGMSCASSTCVMVGLIYLNAGESWFAETWNGVTWSDSSLPTPSALSPQSSWSSPTISCADSTDCVVVGSNGTKLVSEVLHAGSWSIDSAGLSTTTGDVITRLSCGAVGSCIGIGSVTGTGRPIAMKFSSGTWSSVAIPKMPVTKAVTASLTSVACQSASSCWVVGSFTGTGTSPTMLAMHFDGIALTPTALPTPSGSTEAFLNDISCASATSCVAVGNSNSVAIVESLSSSTWSEHSFSTLATLTAVSCPDVGTCDAYGAVVANPNSGFADLTEEKLSAGIWTSVDRATNVPGPILGQPGMWAGRLGLTFGCPTTSLCILHLPEVPSLTAATGPVSVMETSSQWSSQDMAATPREAAMEAQAVSCPNSSMCAVVGESSLDLFDLTYGPYHVPPVAYIENGSSVVESTINFTAGTNDIRFDNLAGVSCASTSFCMAVGGAQVPSPTLGRVEKPFWMTYDGSNWTAFGAPSRLGNFPAVFTSVSCATTTFCSALGYLTIHSSIQFQGFAATWNASTWRYQILPLSVNQPQSHWLYPTNAADGTTGVSCVTANHCEGVQPTNGGSGTELIGWNGAKWSVTTVPTIAHETRITLTSIACVTLTRCYAVGSNSTSAVAATLDGSSWSQRTVPMTSKFMYPRLAGISCRSFSSCTAIGIDDNVPKEVTSFAASMSGTSWTTTALAPQITSGTFPPGFLSVMRGVSCAPGGGCTAVGIASNYPFAAQYGILQSHP